MFSFCDDIQFSHFLNDSHYYIERLDPMFRGRVFAAGGGFWHMPGTYVLPFSEGTYVVYGKEVSDKTNNPNRRLFVKMNTRGTGQYYEHRWVDVPRAAKKFHFGWYYIFSHACNSDDYGKEFIEGFSLNTPPGI